MLHTKFRGNRPAGSAEEDFEGFLSYMGMAASWSCDPDAANILSFPYPRRLHIKFGYDCQAVLEKKMFEHCG